MLSRGENMKKKQVYIFSGIGMAIVFAIAYYLSALLENGMDLEFMGRRLEQIKQHPIANYWNQTTPLFLLLGFAVGIFLMAYMLQQSGNFRFGQEYGTAKWGNIKALNRKLAETDERENHILSEHLRVSYNPKKSDMNNNQVIIGGSGRGKGFRVIYPNVTNCHGAYVITDAKGDTLRSIGKYMEQQR